MPRNYASLLLLQTLQVNALLLLLHTHTRAQTEAAVAAARPQRLTSIDFHLSLPGPAGTSDPRDIHNIYLGADMGERPYCRAAAATHAAGVQFGRDAALLAAYTVHPFSRAPQGSPL